MNKKMQSTNKHCIKFLKENEIEKIKFENYDQCNHLVIGLSISNVDDYPYESLPSLIKIEEWIINDYTDTLQYINEKDIKEKCELLLQIHKDKLNFYYKLRDLLVEFKQEIGQRYEEMSKRN